MKSRLGPPVQRATSASIGICARNAPLPSAAESALRRRGGKGYGTTPRRLSLPPGAGLLKQGGGAVVGSVGLALYCYAQQERQQRILCEQGDTDSSVKAAKIAHLSCYDKDVPFPEDAAAVIIFCSQHSEVAAHVKQLLSTRPQLVAVPFLISGTQAEVEKIREALGDVAGDRVYIDSEAEDTEDNAQYIVSKMRELGLVDKPLVYVNFPVLARNGLYALVHHGVRRDSIFVSFSDEGVDPADPSIKDSWLDAELAAASEGTWNGKGKMETALHAALAATTPSGSAPSVEAENQLREAISRMTKVGPQSEELLAEARARVVELEAHRRARTAFEQARSRLLSDMQGGSIAEVRTAVEMVEKEAGLFTAAVGAPPNDGGLLGEARKKLAELVEIERVLKVQADACDALEKAALSRDAVAIKEALEAAKIAGVQNSKHHALAVALANPERLSTALLAHSPEAQQLDELRKIRGLEVEDFAAAVSKKLATADEATLREQAAEMAGAIMRSYATQTKELDTSLHQASGSSGDRIISRAADTVDRFNDTRDQLEEAQRSAAEHQSKSELKQNTEALCYAVTEQGKAALAVMEKQIEQETADHINSEGQEFNKRLARLHYPVTAVHELHLSGESYGHRSNGSDQLSKALLAVESALGRGSSSQAELVKLCAAGSPNDSFVESILKQLPADTIDWSRGPVPTELELGHRFNGELETFVAGAFAPPMQGKPGLVSKMLARFTGWVFGRLYILSAADGPGLHIEDPEHPHEQVTASNLATLRHAATHVENGDVRSAITVMERLTGECRSRTNAWVTEARHAVLVRQAVRAAHAKAQCLHSGVVA